MVIVVIALIFVTVDIGSLANSTVSTILYYWLESIQCTSDGSEIVIEGFLVPELSVYKFNWKSGIIIILWIKFLTFIMSSLMGLSTFGNVPTYKIHQSHSLIHQRYIIRSAVSTRGWCSQCYLLETRIDRQENQFNDYNHQLLNTNISWKTQRILYTTTKFLFWKKKS